MRRELAAVDRAPAVLAVALALVLLAASRTSAGRPPLEVRASTSGGVTLDTSANVSWTAACFNAFTTSSVSLTVGDNPNRLLVAEISSWSNAPSPAGPPSWTPSGGSPETFTATPGGGGTGPEQTYYLIAPTPGAGAVSWSSGGGSGSAGAGIVASFYNVNQTTPLSVTFGGSGVGVTAGAPIAATPGSSRDAFLFTLEVNGANVGQYPTATPTQPGAASLGSADLKASSGAGCEGNLYAAYYGDASVTLEQFTVSDVLNWYYAYFDIAAAPPPAPPPLSQGVSVLVLAVAMAGLIGLAAAAGMVRTADKNRERVAIAIVVITGAFIVVALGVAFSGLVG